MNGQICATLISGPPGVGKTTIIKKVAKYLSEKDVTYEGFYTEELRDSNPPYNRLGFDIVKLNSGDREILARDSCCVSDANVTNPKVGKYSVFVKEFESFAVPILNTSSNCLIIDEIGKMEVLSRKFVVKIRNLITELKSGRIKLIATISDQNHRQLQIINELKSLSNVKVFQVTKINRNTINTEIENCCLQMFK